MSLFSGCVFFSGKKKKIAYPEAHGLFAGQKPPEAALAADKTSVVSAEKTSVVSRAKTSVAAAEKTPDISISSTTPRGRRRRPCGVVDFIEMSDVAAFLAADTTDVLAADTTDVLYAAKADDGPREAEGRA